jgi:RNA polymerase sigma-70 factor (ECF subfamily)
MVRSTPAETDGQLISCAAAGDREAFGRLYEQYATKVFRHAYFLTGEIALAEDITAQTFLNALQAISRFEPRGVPFTAWLLRIAGNLVINYRKSQKNGTHMQLPETLEAEGSFYSPEQSCEVAVDGERVWQEVRKLGNEQRQVLVMRFVDDLSYPDIALLLGKSVGAVRVIQFRALANLRHLLHDDLNHAFPHQRAS